MNIVKHLTDGGLPSHCTTDSLYWLAGQHWRLAAINGHQHDNARAAWHRRWAVLLTDLLDTRNANATHH